jgi:transposase-like protein
MGEWRIKREEPAPPTRCPKCGSKHIFTWRKDDGAFVQCHACGRTFDMEKETDISRDMAMLAAFESGYQTAQAEYEETGRVAGMKQPVAGVE